jgi:hypothetical protein
MNGLKKCLMTFQRATIDAGGSLILPARHF